MPIRFRCVYCNQLLGIAHRKAGTVVRCPTCAGQVVVPATEAAAEAQNGPAGPSEPFLFEENDLDQLFTPGATEPASAPSPRAGGGPHPVAVLPQPAADAPAGAWGTYAEPPFDVERIDVTAAPQPGAAPAGIVLSSTKATVLSVVWIVSLVLAFGAGLLVGLLMRPTPPQEEGRAPAVTHSRWV